MGNRTTADGQDPPLPELTAKQREVQERLCRAIRESLPVEAVRDRVEQRAQNRYRRIGELVVDLRHEFPGPGGEPHDFRGRSAGYRSAVREAYALAGADLDEPIPKRLTAAVAYWVRKILVERYGERTLCQYNVIRAVPVETNRDPDADGNVPDSLPRDPTTRLDTVIGILNTLAVDPRLTPSEEAVRAAFRAVLLLRKRLLATDGHPDGAVDGDAEPTREREPHLTAV